MHLVCQLSFQCLGFDMLTKESVGGMHCQICANKLSKYLALQKNWTNQHTSPQECTINKGNVWEL